MEASKVLEVYSELSTLLELLTAKYNHYKELYSHANMEKREEEAMGFYWEMRDTEEQRQKVATLRGEVIKLHPDYPDFEKVFNSTVRKAETLLNENK
ncbi:hypothetical protein ACLM5H_24585 [Fredinandcohnia humi]